MIKFKSNPKFYEKEIRGIKPNTVRIFEKNDIRFKVLNDFIDGDYDILYIQIINTETKKSFIRAISDVSLYNGYYIISWQHLL